MKNAYRHFDPPKSGKASRLVERLHRLDDQRMEHNRRTLHTGPSIQRHHNHSPWYKLKPFCDPQSHRLSIPHGNGHKISYFKGLFTFGANHIFSRPDSVHSFPTIALLKNPHLFRRFQRDRQAAFQLATCPTLKQGVFHFHGGFRMGDKGRFCLGAIVTRQDGFPLPSGFRAGHKAPVYGVFRLKSTHGAFINPSHADLPPFKIMLTISKR
nr:MAG TPA: hypothetical protein [Caudoviricetes sp.]